MEVDEFTEGVMERAKARKEYLRKKMNEIRKRTALAEENQIVESYGSLKYIDDDDSPKRQRLQESADEAPKVRTEYEYDESNSEDEEIDENGDSEEEDKENEPSTDSSFVPYIKPGVRGLAALKRDNWHSSSQPQVSSNDKGLSKDSSDDLKESQGYVKSESSSKLSYNFKQNSPAKHLPETATQQSAKVATDNVRSTPGTTSDQNQQSVSTSAQESKISEGNLNASSADPAELPLSARKALFEKALFSGSNKQNSNVIEPNMSVAQRAALFEKAAKAPAKQSTQKNFLREPQKFSNAQLSPSKSPVKSLEPSSPAKLNYEKTRFSPSPVKRFPAPSPSKVGPSPSKNAGAHTRFVQQQLIESSTTNLKKDIAGDGKKTEISSLLNHWEKMSSANYETARVPNRDVRKISSSSGSEKYSTVFEDEAEESDHEDPSIEEEDYENNEEIQNQVSESEPDESEEEPDEEQDGDEEEGKACGHVTSSSFEFRKYDASDDEDDSDEEVAVDDIIDEAMDEALKDEMAMPPPVPSLPADPKYAQTGSKCSSSVSSTGSFGSGSQESILDNQRCCSGSTPTSNRTPSESSEDSEVPLMHTVSFYRRQKQEKRATPIRTIVRKETVSSPPSPDQDKNEEIRGRIKALQEEILAQQTVISQTSQALNLCLATEEFSGSTEQVECERLLLIATQRRQACLNELQRLKSCLSSGRRVIDGTGTLILNDIRLPLKQDFIASNKDGKKNDDVHYFICLVRHGHQVIVTQMLSAQDGVQQGSLCFTNHITLHELPSDFSVAFEVYTLRSKKEMLPHDRKYHIKKDHSKLRLTTKSRKGDSKLLSPVISSPGGPNAVRSPNFSVVGFTRFTLQNCNRQIYTLEKVPFSSPLDGVLKLNMHLHAEHKIAERGFLTMFEDVSGFGAWHRRWCLLDGKDMAFWKYPDDEKRKEPMLVITLKQCITSQVKLVSRDVCARPHTFELVTVRPQVKGDKNTLISRSVNTLTTTKYLLSADTKEERILWCNRLNDALTNVRKWDPQAMRPIEARLDK